MATIQDIADRANVSKATVSRVINNTSAVNESTREAVVAAMTELQFQPNMMARSLAGGRSMTIGILTQNIGSPFYDTIAQGVIAGLADTGYSPIFVDGQWQKTTTSEVILTLLGRNVDGLVLIGGETPVEELNRLRDRLPTIVVGRLVEGWENQCVYADNEQAGYEAAKHLLEFGHRDIAFVHGIKEHPDAVQRFDGYKRALDEAGIELSEELVYYGDFSGQAGIQAVTSLIARGIYFSGLLAANDMVAFGARLALHRQGIRVPEDVSVVGFDDQAEAAFMTPPLTTMRQPAQEMGAHAAAMLLKLIGGKAVDSPRLTIELLRRESVTRLR